MSPSCLSGWWRRVTPRRCNLDRLHERASFSGDYVAEVTYDALDRPLDLELGGSAVAPVMTSTHAHDPVLARLEEFEAWASRGTLVQAAYGIEGAGAACGRWPTRRFRGNRVTRDVLECSVLDWNWRVLQSSARKRAATPGRASAEVNGDVVKG